MRMFYPKIQTLRTVFTLYAFLCLFSLPLKPLEAEVDSKPFSSLLSLAGGETVDAQPVAFREFSDGFDKKIHAANLEFFESNPDLVEKIRSDLGGQALEWHLKRISQRPLYISENRPEYIRLYEAYCRQTISKFLDQVQLPNPYAEISTLPEAGWTGAPPDGMNAYIVRDLTLEYRAEYEFRSAARKSVAIELKGLFSTGEVGSYASELVFDDAGGVHFIHAPYTIWKNNAENPYTMLMTPVEETLHILLRSSTETAIKHAIDALDTRTREAAEKIVDEWIGVEEAIVGGLVYHLLPPILETQVGAIPSAYISQDLETKAAIAKYSHLKQGIRLVGELGYETCLRLYMDNPVSFGALLTQKRIAAGENPPAAIL